MNESDLEKDEALVIEDIEMSDKIRRLVVKEKLPQSLGPVMEEMKAG